MIINDLFTKPIDRPINGVIKADQNDDESVWQELDEYVITQELDEHFRTFFDAYLSAVDNPNSADAASKVGVWISGFFGSGKSHFLKILSYLLANDTHTRGEQSKQAIEFFDGKIEDTMLAADIKRAAQTDVDVILFNIDSKAEAGDGPDAILRVFLKVLNEKLGYSGVYPHLADLERYLEKRGELKHFHQAFEKEAGEAWHTLRDHYQFHTDELCSALAQALGKSTDAAQAWLDKSEKDFSLSVESFAGRVKDYLDSKPTSHRLIFLVDEIGQFIGQNNRLMLSLQTITENLGTMCNGRAWVVVTSQEDIDAVIGEVRASQANDFSKIQGRFKSRLSLSSQNVDEVIQHRLLSKVPAAEQALSELYAPNENLLKNQLSFKDTGMTFRAYTDTASFVRNYPFAPFQFQLVQKIFEAIRKHGVTGINLARGERSMLDAFQLAAKSQLQAELGVLVPLHRFYPSIASSLEGVVKSTIHSSENNPKLKPFDGLVLKTLFLIRYVEEIKGNLDNLVTLFVDRIDADRVAIRQQLEDSVSRLERETLISRNGQDYYFLTNEERDVSREIKDVTLNPGDTSKLIGKLLFEDVLKDEAKHTYTKNTSIFDLNRSCDRFPHRTQREGGLMVAVVSSLSGESDQYGVLESGQDGGQVIIRLNDDSTLGQELRTYLQTDLYVARKNDGSLPNTTLKIIKERQEENRERRDRLVSMIDALVVDGRYFVAGKELKVPGETARKKVHDAIDYLITNTFNKLSYIDHLASNVHAEITAVLNATDVDDLGFDMETGQGNPQAMDEVLRYVELKASQSQQVVLQDLVDRHFARRPYGWPKWETVLIVARLLRTGQLALSRGGSTVAPANAAECLLGPSKWSSLTLSKRKSVDSATLQRARQLAKDCFGTTPPDGEDATDRFIREKLEAWKRRVDKYAQMATGDRYPGKALMSAISQIANCLLAEAESTGLIEQFLANKDELADRVDDLAELTNFFDHQSKTWDALQQAAMRFKVNKDWLVQRPEAREALDRMSHILQADEPFAMIKDVTPLIDTVDQINAELLEDRRKNAIERVDARITQVQSSLEQIEADPSLSNQCLRPLQTLKSGAQADTVIGNLITVPERAQIAADDAIALIERAAEKAMEKAQTVAAPGGPTNPPTLKKRRIVRLAQFTLYSDLKDAQQVDEFLQALRDELMDALDKDEQIELR